jgi:hypothetical protein
MAATDIFENLTEPQRKALQRIVSNWISAISTPPPYGDAYYDIFEALGMAEDSSHSYDTRRPK